MPRRAGPRACRSQGDSRAQPWDREIRPEGRIGQRLHSAPEGGTRSAPSGGLCDVSASWLRDLEPSGEWVACSEQGSRSASCFTGTKHTGLFRQLEVLPEQNLITVDEKALWERKKKKKIQKSSSILKQHAEVGRLKRAFEQAFRQRPPKLTKSPPILLGSAPSEELSVSGFTSQARGLGKRLPDNEGVREFPSAQDQPASFPMASGSA